MKRLLMLATILAVLTVTVPQLSAAGPQGTTPATPTTQSQPVATQVAAAPQRKGFFSRLWELEKRKNAAIRRMLGWE